MNRILGTLDFEPVHFDVSQAFAVLKAKSVPSVLSLCLECKEVAAVCL